VLGLCAYLDDSGSDDGSELVTCGGPVMSRIDSKAFSGRWARMLARYKVTPPLHMADFVEWGKYSTWYPEIKRALFRDVSTRINEHKLYSISIAIPQTDFKEELIEDVRMKLVGPYAFAFFSVIAANQALSEKLRSGPVRISYLVDQGFGHQQQLSEAHAGIANLEIKAGGFRHTGPLAFEADNDVPALQAADVVSWASRRKELGGVLPEGFEPLQEVLREDLNRPHRTIPIPRGGIKMLADPINAWIARKGDAPALGDIIR
jgi:hypothetical protein